MSLPPLFQRWIDEALDRELPTEQRASCLRCPMSQEFAPERPAEAAFFHPRSKCCTYLPVLRNFQVGAVLADTDPAMAFGRRTVRERIARHTAITPLGLGWPATFERMYGEDMDRDFGQRVQMRCPHYIDRDGGLCGVWRHRNAICSTWFCRHESGYRGREVWKAVEKLLDIAELGVTLWCLEQLDMPAALMATLAHDDSPEATLDGDVEITEELRRGIWGPWFGREEELYVASAELVADAGWDLVVQVGGARVRRKLERLEEALEDLDNERLPPFVQGGTLVERVEDEQGVWVSSSGRPYDIEPMPRELVEVLKGLGALDTDDLVERVEERLRRKVAASEVRAWVDQGLLDASLPFKGDDGP